MIVMRVIALLLFGLLLGTLHLNQASGQLTISPGAQSETTTSSSSVINLEPATLPTGFNNNTGNVNSSDYWDNLNTPNDITGRWLNISHSVSDGQTWWEGKIGSVVAVSINALFSPFNVILFQSHNNYDMGFSNDDPLNFGGTSARMVFFNSGNAAFVGKPLQFTGRTDEVTQLAFNNSGVVVPLGHIFYNNGVQVMGQWIGGNGIVTANLTVEKNISVSDTGFFRVINVSTNATIPHNPIDYKTQFTSFATNLTNMRPNDVRITFNIKSSLGAINDDAFIEIFINPQSSVTTTRVCKIGIENVLVGVGDVFSVCDFTVPVAHNWSIYATTTGTGVVGREEVKIVDE